MTRDRPEKIRRAASQALDLLFPPRCVHCRSETPETVRDSTLCSRCRVLLIHQQAVVCRRCAGPLPEHFPPSAPCPHCGRDRFAFARTAALGVYEGALHEAVLRIKGAYEEPLALALGRELAERVESLNWPPLDLAAPIPMPWTRRLRRGVNSAELLAEAVARRLQHPFFPRLLAFRRRRERQHLLSAAQRRANMRGAFRLSKGYDIREAHILVVDDVFTTGATAHAAAGALREAGAAEVSVAVVARGVGT